MAQIRVATYNILMGARRGQPVDRVVRGISPDVLLVNETPKGLLVWRSQCRRLAERWNLRFVTGGRPAGSNMILVGTEVAVKQSGSEKLKQPLFQPRRGIAWAQLRVHGKLVGVVSCHLSLDRDRRLGEVRRVVELAGQLRGPVIVAGDLNELPSGPSWRLLESAGFADHGSRQWLTFPSDKPEKRIDALLVRGAADVLSHGDAGVPDALLAAASDHRPILAVLDIR